MKPGRLLFVASRPRSPIPGPRFFPALLGLAAAAGPTTRPAVLPYRNLRLLRPHAIELTWLAIISVLAAGVLTWACLWRDRDAKARPGARAVLIGLALAALAILAQVSYQSTGVGWGWIWRLTTWVLFRYWVRYTLVVVTVAAWAVSVGVVLRGLTDRRSRLGKALRSAALVVFSILFLAIGAEAYFRLFYAAPDSLDFTLANQRWNARYWQPINRQGFRDAAWPRREAEVGGRRLIFVVGDAFAAGAGIRDVAHRFSNRLAAKLGPEHVVVTVARCGWDTRQQLEFLEGLTVAPDVVVWSYVYNDIRDLAQEAGFQQERRMIFPRGRLGSLVRDSHLANFVYWRLHRMLVRPEEDFDYHELLQEAYQDPEVWLAHAQALEQVIAYARSKEARLVVVVWGDLPNLVATASVTARVTRFFRERGVPVVDVTEHLSGEDPRRLTVSSTDAHPSEETHRRVAEMLYEELTRAPAGTQPG